ncbi:SEC14-like protein 2 [Saccoglossus kowalevskii]
MSGTVGDMTPKQTEKLKEFKSKVNDILEKPEHDDHYCLRWLRARNFDVVKAEALIRSNMEQRKKWGIDSILTNYKVPEVLEKHYQGGMVGEDKEGHPVWIDPLGKMDMKGLMRSAKRKDIILSRIRFSEQLYHSVFPERSKKYGKHIESITYIVDMEGLGTKHLWKPGLDTCIEFITLLQDMYPESLKIAYFVRVPRIFAAIYALLKPFVDVDVRNKIHVLSNNFQSTLLKDIPAESLPVHWGGTMTDPETGDPKCPHLINLGGPVPEKYYCQEPIVPEDKNLNKEIVKKKFDLTFEVKKKDSAIRYVFKTEGGDIGLSVFLQYGKNEIKQIQEMEKHNSHLVYEDGSIDCPEVGTYILRFDNSHSWTKNKTLYYFAEVVEPDTLFDAMSTE